MSQTVRRRGAWDREPLAFLSSGGLAIGLLMLLVLLLFLYLFVPQWGPDEGERLEAWVAKGGSPARLCRLLGITDIRRSGWLAGTLALLGINLLFCLVRRFHAMLLLLRVPAALPASVPGASRRRISAGSAEPSEIAALLRRRGYRTLVAEGAVYGLRGRLGVIGHWLFHASLLLLLGVGAYVALSPSPFRGTLGIGEGESFDLHNAPYLGTNQPVSPDLPGLRFRLEAIDVRTEGRDVRQLEARVATPQDTGGRLGINRPFRQAPYQVMAHGFGYMPGWVIVDRAGTMLKGAWVKLVPFPSPGEDSFRIGPKTSEVTVRFFPDYSESGDRQAAAGHELRNPRFHTRITLRGETIYEGLLQPDERVPLGEDREFFFLPEIRRYLLVDVIREREHHIVFVTLAVMILGLALRYARLRKEILVTIEGGDLVLLGRCEILEALFEEELDRLCKDLRRCGRAPAGRRAVA